MIILILTIQYCLSITPTVWHSEESEWILDMGATYHVCLKWKLFASFEKLNGGLLSLRDGYTYQIEEIGTVRILGPKAHHSSFDDD